MAVTDVKFLDATGTETEDGTIGYTSRWQVLTNAMLDGPRTVLAASELPRRGHLYAVPSGESDGVASCRSRSVSLAGVDETRKRWIVSCEYSSKGSSSNPDDQAGGPQNPVDWSWRCSGDTWARMEAPDYDRNGRPFLNTALEPFMPPPENENIDPLIVLEKNHPSLNLTAWNESQGKVNSGIVWELAARKVKLKRWTFQQHWTGGGGMYFSNRLEVEIKFSGYYYQPPNMGHREIVGVDPVTGKPVVRQILDELSVPLSRPVPLDQFGQQLPAGAATLFFDQQAGPLQRFEKEDEYDLSSILPPVLPGNFT